MKLYVADMIWGIARTHYNSDFPMPSEIWHNKRKDRRSATQILDDLINGLGGE